jgi:hypothetical protein
MSSIKLLGQDWKPDDWKNRDYIARAYNAKGYTKVTPEHAWVQMYIDAMKGQNAHLPGSGEINTIEDVINHIEDTPEGTIPGSEWFRGEGKFEDSEGNRSLDYQYLPSYMGKKDLTSGFNISFKKQFKDAAPPPDPEKGQFNSVADIPKFYEGPQPVIQNVSANGYVTYEPVTQAMLDEYNSGGVTATDFSTGETMKILGGGTLATEAATQTSYWNIKDYAGFQDSGLVFDYNTNDWRPITDSERTDVNFAGQSLNLFTGNLWDNEKGAVSSSITDFYGGQAEPVEDSPQTQVEDVYESDHAGGKWESKNTIADDVDLSDEALDANVLKFNNEELATVNTGPSSSELKDTINTMLNPETETLETDQAIIRDSTLRDKIDLTTAGTFERDGQETSVPFDAITEGTEDKAYTTGADVTSFDIASSGAQGAIEKAGKIASRIRTESERPDIAEGPIPGKPAEGVRMKRSQAAKNRQGLLGTGQFRRTKDAEYTK